MLAGLWLVYVAFGVVAASLAPIVPQVSHDLGIGNVGMGAILGAWPLVYIVSAVPCGMVLDRLGARPSLLVAGLFVGGSALARGIAETPVTMFLAVALFGIGGPLVSVGAPKLVAHWFRGASRGTAIGIYVSGPALGSAAALAFTHDLLPLAGGWRMLMMLYGAFALAAGLAWFAVASASVATAFDTPDIANRTKGGVRKMLALGPMRIVLTMGVLIFFLNHATNNWLPEILRAEGLDAGRAGDWASLTTLAGIVGSLLIPRLAVPERRVAIAATLFATATVSFLLIRFAPELELNGALMPALIALGLARGSMVAVTMLFLMEMRGLSPERIGTAGGLFFVAAEIGGVLGPLTVGLVSDLSGDFDGALLALAGAAFLLVILTTRLAVRTAID